jgi:hypothetical protein
MWIAAENSGQSAIVQEAGDQENRGVKIEQQLSHVVPDLAGRQGGRPGRE